MSTPPDQTATATGAAMDHKIFSPRAANRKHLRLVLFGIVVLVASVLSWRLISSGNSTDVASADVETGALADAPFHDYLPVRAIVAPLVTTFVGVVSGGQVDKLLVQDGTMVAVGQPLATLDNPTLKLDILTRESAIASQLGTVSGDDLALEHAELDRATQTASASYDLIKARRDLSIRQQLHDQGFVSDEGVASYREENEYQQNHVAQLKSGETKENGIAAVQALRLAETRGWLSGNLSAVEASFDALTVTSNTSAYDKAATINIR